MRSEVVGDPLHETIIPDAPAADVHLLDVLIILSRRRRFIAWFTIGLIVLTTIILFVLPNKFTAETVVLPPSQNTSLSSSLLSQVGGSAALASLAGNSLGIKNPGEMYVSLFRGRTVEDSLIHHFGLMARYHSKTMSDARRAFESRSSVVLGVKDGLIRINVTDRDPKMASDLANGYVDEFRRLSANLAITEASQRRAFFQQQLTEANTNLTNAEEKMKRTEQTTGVLQVDSQARSLIESAVVLRAQIVATEVEIEAMRSYATEDNPQLVRDREQLNALKAQLAKLGGTLPNSNSEIIVPKGNIPQAGMEYLRAFRDVRYYETVADLIARQFEIAKLDEAREGAIIQVADLAVPPDRHSFPKRSITLLIAIFASFFLACAWCIFAAAIERVRNNPAERHRMDALRATFARK